MNEIRFICKNKICECSFGTAEEASEHYDTHHVCSICALDFTSHKREKLSCTDKECNGNFCKECLKTIIKTTEGLLRCPHCSDIFDIEFLRSCNFGLDFFNKFVFPKTTQAFLKEQKSLLVSTQKYAKWQDDLDHWKRVTRKDYNSKIQSLKEAIRDLNKDLYSKYPRYDPASETVKFNFRCPSEDCHGMIGHGGICGFCSKEFCLECREEKGPGHVCDPSILENIKFLKDQSKPCPHCGIFTMKSEGCNQMWCRNCNNFWNFQTGKIEEIYAPGQIHNPDYFAYMRQVNAPIPRAGERMSDMIPERRGEMLDFAITHPVYHTSFYPLVYRIHRHVEDVNSTVRWMRTDMDEKYREIRSTFIRGIIDEKTFEKKLIHTKKLEMKKNKVSELQVEYIRQKKLIIRNIMDIVGFYAPLKSKKFRFETDKPDIFKTKLSAPRAYECFIFDEPKGLPSTKLFFSDITQQLEQSDRLTDLFDKEIKKVLKSLGFSGLRNYGPSSIAGSKSLVNCYDYQYNKREYRLCPDLILHFALIQN
jgi:hypothetical protein